MEKFLLYYRSVNNILTLSHYSRRFSEKTHIGKSSTEIKKYCWKNDFYKLMKAKDLKIIINLNLDLKYIFINIQNSLLDSFGLDIIVI